MYDVSVLRKNYMSLLTFISSEGVVNEVEDDSVAAELMREGHFTLISIDGERQPITAIEPQPPTEPATAVPKSTINAAMIRELMAVKEEKLWRKMGFKSFGSFLDSEKVPQFGKSKFYKLRDLLLAEGDEAFDFLMAD